jgi:hypothetical protein
VEGGKEISEEPILRNFKYLTYGILRFTFCSSKVAMSRGRRGSKKGDETQ